jgi:hypothetical protein
VEGEEKKYTLAEWEEWEQEGEADEENQDGEVAESIQDSSSDTESIYSYKGKHMNGRTLNKFLRMEKEKMAMLARNKGSDEQQGDTSDSDSQQGKQGALSNAGIGSPEWKRRGKYLLAAGAGREAAKRTEDARALKAVQKARRQARQAKTEAARKEQEAQREQDEEDGAGSSGSRAILVDDRQTKQKSTGIRTDKRKGRAGEAEAAEQEVAAAEQEVVEPESRKPSKQAKKGKQERVEEEEGHDTQGSVMEQMLKANAEMLKEIQAMRGEMGELRAQVTDSRSSRASDSNGTQGAGTKGGKKAEPAATRDTPARGGAKGYTEGPTGPPLMMMRQGQQWKRTDMRFQNLPVYETERAVELPLYNHTAKKPAKAACKFAVNMANAAGSGTPEGTMQLHGVPDYRLPKTSPPESPATKDPASTAKSPKAAPKPATKAAQPKASTPWGGMM